MDRLTILKSIVILLGLDAVYLFVTHKYFARVVRGVTHDSRPPRCRVASIAACYTFILFGLNYFVLSSVGVMSKRAVVMNAALLGLVVYGVFETTNYAIFGGWPVSAVLMDTAWGSVLFAVTAYLCCL